MIMKQIILFTLIVILNSRVYSQSEAEIYKHVISDFVLKHRQPNTDDSQPTTLIVLETPAYMIKIDDSDYSRFKEKYKKLDQQTFEDFIKKNQVNFQFENLKVADIETVMFNKESRPNWEELYSTYPNWDYRILEFSNIGFNEVKNQAMVYYGFDSGATGGGVYIIYKKKGIRWKIKKVISAWAA